MELAGTELKARLAQQIDKATYARGQSRVVGLESDRERLQRVRCGIGRCGTRDRDGIGRMHPPLDIRKRRVQSPPGAVIQARSTRQLGVQVSE